VGERQVNQYYDDRNGHQNVGLLAIQHLMQLLAQEYFIEPMYLSNHEHVP